MVYSRRKIDCACLANNRSRGRKTQKKTTKDELKAVVGDRFPEIMSRLRSGNVFMQHDGGQQVSWDVKGQEGEAKVITGDGLYSARTLGGDNVVGMVCQATGAKADCRPPWTIPKPRRSGCGPLTIRYLIHL